MVSSCVIFLAPLAVVRSSATLAGNPAPTSVEGGAGGRSGGHRRSVGVVDPPVGAFGGLDRLDRLPRRLITGEVPELAPLAVDLGPSCLGGVHNLVALGVHPAAAILDPLGPVADAADA